MGRCPSCRDLHNRTSHTYILQTRATSNRGNPALQSSRRAKKHEGWSSSPLLLRGKEGVEFGAFQVQAWFLLYKRNLAEHTGQSSVFLHHEQIS